MKRYKYLLLDADGTLFDFLKAEKHAFGDVCRGFGLSDIEGLHPIYSQSNINCWELHEKGLITKNELKIKRFADFIAHAGLSLDPAEMNAMYMRRLSEYNFLFPGVEEAMRALAGFAKLYIITNGIEYTQKKRMYNSPITKYMSDCFISESCGFAKPDSQYFDYVFNNIPGFDGNKADCLVVGDSFSSDILGAYNAGTDSCFIGPMSKKPPEKLEKASHPTYRYETFEAFAKDYIRSLT